MQYKLSNETLDAVLDYRSCYVQEISGRPISSKTYLKQYMENKETLFHLLGDNFIVSFPYEIEVNDEGKRLRMKNDDVINNVIESFYYKLRYIEGLYSDEFYDFYHMLTDMYALITNRVQKNIKLSEDSRIINKGAKLMGVLQKLNREYHAVPDAEFERFRNIVSTYTQTKTMKGTFYLSIHPLDYMTMSDNNANWKSCMNWMNEGEYRLGTVEMMNSPCAVVGYLRAEQPWHITQNHKWNSKLWRCLYVVNEDIITSVKSYPYFSKELITVGLNKLKELAANNVGWYYEDKITESDEMNFEFNAGESSTGFPVYKYLSFETNAMYNDFGSTIHYAYLHKDIINRLEPHQKYTYINYSGPAICADCGDFMTGNEDQVALVCDNCCHYLYCEDCECRLREDEVHEYDDYILCYDCYCDRKYQEEDEFED